METPQILGKLRARCPAVERRPIVLDARTVLADLRERIAWCKATEAQLRRSELRVPTWVGRIN